MEHFEQQKSQPIQHQEINKKHGVPALISFFIPGLGQMIKGHIGKGILIWVIAGICMFILINEGLLGYYGLPVIYGWNIYDAYNSN